MSKLGYMDKEGMNRGLSDRGKVLNNVGIERR